MTPNDPKLSDGGHKAMKFTRDASRRSLKRVVRRWVFGSLPPDADGWYIWRNSPTWPKHEYKCIEIANGVMVDTEPMDSYGADWRVVECKPYGQFRGPILPR